MKLVIPKKELKEALVAMSKIVYDRTSLPILGAVRIDGTGKEVRVSGTDIEQSLSWIIKDGSGTGSFIVNMQELKDYLKNGGTSTTVQFERMGKSVSAVFFAGNIPCIRQFNTFPEKEWPMLPSLPVKGKHIAGNVFDNIRKAIPSASKDATRRILPSVLLESDAVVATSGKELVKLHCSTGIKESAVIPVTKFIKSSTFAGDTGTLSVEETNDIKFCSFTTDRWVYTTKCVFGTYPNYRQVIPKSSESSIELSPETIASLIKDIPELESDEEFETVHLYADNKQIKILPSNYTGTALTIDGKFKGNRPVTVSVSRNLLLRAINLGFTKLSFTDGDGFAPITAKDSKGLYVFMPLRTSETDKIREAVKMSGSNAVAKQGSDKKLEFHGKSPEPEAQGYKPVTALPERINTEDQQERSEDRITKKAAVQVQALSKKKAVQVPLIKEDRNMSEETKAKLGFQVVGETETDHFEELQNSIMEVRVKAKEVFDMTGTLSRHVKDAQRAQKAKEREFKSTRDLLGKLKKVSGF